MVDLTISIVSNNNRALLDRCLDSIIRNTISITYEIIVVDNCSADGSAAMVREKYPQVKVIEKDRPGGYSENHNIVLKNFNGRYAAILNDDVEALPGCFDEMTKTLNEFPDIGCLGCRLLNADGSLQQSVYRLPSISVLVNHAFFLGSIFKRSVFFTDYKCWPHDEFRHVEFIIGACMMLPRETIEKIGLMDDGFFVYAEDSDLCKRVLDAGWKVSFTPKAQMIHHGGSSMKQIGDRPLAYKFQSMRRYFAKHFGRWTLPIVDALNVIAALNRAIVFAPGALAGNESLKIKFSNSTKTLAYYFKIGPFKRG